MTPEQSHPVRAPWLIYFGLAVFLIGITFATTRDVRPAVNVTRVETLQAVNSSGTTTASIVGASGAGTFTGQFTLSGTQVETPCIVPAFAIGAGPFNNWNPGCLATNRLIQVTCADNNGTWITGIDAVDNPTTIGVGSKVTVCNENATEDAGSCVFGLDDTQSVAGNRIWYGNRTSTTWTDRFRLGTGDCATFRYAQPNQADPTIFRWVIESTVLNVYRSKIQNLAVFPPATPAAITGTVHDWSPVPCSAVGYPAGGSCEDGGSTDFSDYSFIDIATVDGTGATIGGMVPGPGLNSGKNEFQFKWLFNAGPGPIKILNQDAGSAFSNRFSLPNSMNIMIPVLQAKLFVWIDASWVLIGSTFSQFDNGVTTTIGPLQVADSPNPTLSTVGVADVLINPIGTGQTDPPSYLLGVRDDSLSIDTTGAAKTVYGVVALAQATRSAGANPLTNVALFGNASGAQVNYALMSQAGSIYFAQGGDAGTFYDNHAYFDENKGIKAEGIGAGGLETALTLCGGDFNGNAQSQLASAALPTANHGTLSGDASNFQGEVTGVGANQSVTLTFGGGGFGTTSHCHLTVEGSSTVGMQVSTVSNTAPVFSCFTLATGAGANCPNFVYQCWGH
jgi:hypothetical protein